MKEELLNNFMQKSNCERLGIISGVIENLLEEFSRSEQSIETLEVFYTSLLGAAEEGFFAGPEMDCNGCSDFNFYLNLLNDTLSRTVAAEDLTACLQMWKKNKVQFAILNNMRGPLDNFELQSADVSMENCLYLDFNIYESIEKKGMTDLMHGIDIVYSPIHLEETYRMKDEQYIKMRKDTIARVTNCHIILQMGDVFQVYREDPERSYERVLANLELSEGFEQDRLVKADDRDIFFNDIYVKYRQDINRTDDLFEAVSWEEISSMLQFSGCYLSREDFKIKDGTRAGDILTMIYALYNMMDNLSYCRDKKKKDGRTYRSAVYDMEHLRYAANCRYFITRDENLAKRARQIFKFLEIRTEVIFISDPSKINSIIKDLVC